MMCARGHIYDSAPSLVAAARCAKGEERRALPHRPRPPAAQHTPLATGTQTRSRPRRQPLPVRGARLLRPAGSAAPRGDQVRRCCVRPREHRAHVQAPSLPARTRDSDASAGNATRVVVSSIQATPKVACCQRCNSGRRSRSSKNRTPNVFSAMQSAHSKTVVDRVRVNGSEGHSRATSFVVLLLPAIALASFSWWLFVAKWIGAAVLVVGMVIAAVGSARLGH
jgi:hypothetical protein